MKKKTMTIVICALLAILILLAGTIVVLLTKKDTDKEPEKNDNVYVMDEGNYVQIQDEMAERVSEGYFETYMTTEWTFPDGASEATDAVLGNSPNNVKPIRCEVLLAETGEKIFSTGVMPVGALLPSIKLDVDLEAGVYEAVCMIYLLDETETGGYTDYSSAGFNVTIIVQN